MASYQKPTLRWRIVWEDVGSRGAAVEGASADFEIRGGIVWGNLDSDGSGVDHVLGFLGGASASQVTWIRTDLQDWGGVTWNTAYGTDPIGGDTMLSIDPSFSDLPAATSSGTATGNFHPGAAGIIDLGDDTIVDLKGILEDLGMAPRKQGAGVDMGAYEEG